MHPIARKRVPEHLEEEEKEKRGRLENSSDEGNGVGIGEMVDLSEARLEARRRVVVSVVSTLLPMLIGNDFVRLDRRGDRIVRNPRMGRRRKLRINWVEKFSAEEKQKRTFLFTRDQIERIIRAVGLDPSVRCAGGRFGGRQSDDSGKYFRVNINYLDAFAMFFSQLRDRSTLFYKAAVLGCSKPTLSKVIHYVRRLLLKLANQCLRFNVEDMARNAPRFQAAILEKLKEDPSWTRGMSEKCTICAFVDGTAIRIPKYDLVVVHFICVR